MTHLIEVTQEDIEKAIEVLKNPLKFRCQNCPVAQGVKRKLGVERGVEVTDEEIFLTDRGYRRSIELPENAQSFIGRFDKKLNVSPFTFEIDL